MTPWYYNNPGTAVFELRDKDYVPTALKHSFLNLEPTIGKDKVTPFN